MKYKKFLPYILVIITISLLFIFYKDEGIAYKDLTIKSDILGEEEIFNIDCSFPYNNILIMKVSLEDNKGESNKKYKFPKGIGKNKDGRFIFRDYKGDVIGHTYWNGRTLITDENKDGNWDSEDYILYIFPLNVKYDSGKYEPVLNIEEFNFLEINIIKSKFVINFDNNIDLKSVIYVSEDGGFLTKRHSERKEITELDSFNEDIYKMKKEDILKWVEIEESKSNDTIGVK